MTVNEDGLVVFKARSERGNQMHSLLPWTICFYVFSDRFYRLGLRYANAKQYKTTAPISQPLFEILHLFRSKLQVKEND